jgi:hypothetical protein
MPNAIKDLRDEKRPYAADDRQRLGIVCPALAFPAIRRIPEESDTREEKLHISFAG